MSRKIAILGATGSIGTQALEVISNYPDDFEITLLTSFKNVTKLLEYADRFSARHISTPHSESFEKIKGDPRAISWKEAESLISEGDTEIVLNALVGAAGLKLTVITLLAGKKLLLANKESLVIGGDFINRTFSNWRELLIPVDSEHSAVFQCLTGEKHEKVSHLILTGSGGPFRGKKKDELENVTPEQALKHPTWQMGPKITIDSATLMNKGLEVIEAHYLFDMPYDRIKVVIHPQSIVHGMVVFSDGTVKAVMSNPDMKLPIEYALFYPDRRDLLIDPLDVSNLTLEFEPPDTDNFPCLNLAYEAGRKGGIFPAVLNAANEVAVAAFLRNQIKFTRIPVIIEETLSSFSWKAVETISDIVEADRRAREIARSLIKS